MLVKTYFRVCMAAVAMVGILATSWIMAGAWQDYVTATRVAKESDVVGRLLKLPETIIKERSAIGDIVLPRAEQVTRDLLEGAATGVYGKTALEYASEITEAARLAFSIRDAALDSLYATAKA